MIPTPSPLIPLILFLATVLVGSVLYGFTTGMVGDAVKRRRDRKEYAEAKLLLSRLTTFPPWKALGQCPKCGTFHGEPSLDDHPEPVLKYVGTSGHYSFSGGPAWVTSEHIIQSCVRCGYSIRTRPREDL